MAGGGIKITDAINSIPERKEKLRKAFEALQSSDCSSFFPLPNWKDVDDHFSALEKSIHDQFKSLPPSIDKDRITIEPVSEEAAPAEALKMITPKEEDLGDNDNADEEASPRPELRSLCVSMDGKGLLSYIYDNRKEIEAIKKELGPALRCAPNPALLVLNAMQEFYLPPTHSDVSKRKQQNKRGRSAPPRDSERENKEAARTHFNQGTCVTLLDKLHRFSPEIDPSIKEMAKNLALKWKARIHKTGGGGGGDALEAMGLLQLISSYRLLSVFTVDDVLELFLLIARRRLSINIFRTLGLSDKLPGNYLLLLGQF